LGVEGYAGGHSATTAAIRFDPTEHVGRGALRLAEALGAVPLPDNRPRLFPTSAEIEAAELQWHSLGRRTEPSPTRLVVSPGAGLPEKRWPLDRFVELVRRLLHATEDLVVIVTGGPQDRAAGRALAGLSPRVQDRCGGEGLRRTFALVATSHGVITNSSLVLHVAGAFRKPALVLLGPSFPSVAAHDAQWSHPAALTLGRELPARDQIATVDEAFEAASRHLVGARSEERRTGP
jgi:heptosyltransferase-2